MARYHIGENGPGPCGADPNNPKSRGCPYGGESGDENHYATEQEAVKAFELQLAQQYGNLATLSKVAKSNNTAVMENAVEEEEELYDSPYEEYIAKGGDPAKYIDPDNIEGIEKAEAIEIANSKSFSDEDAGKIIDVISYNSEATDEDRELLRKSMIENQSLSYETQKAFYVSKGMGKKSGFFLSDRQQLAFNANAHPGLRFLAQAELLRYHGIGVQIAGTGQKTGIASMANLDPLIEEALLKDHSDGRQEIHQALAENPTTSSEALNHLVIRNRGEGHSFRNREPQVLTAVAGNPNSTPETLDLMKNNNYTDVLKALVANPKTSPETIAHLKGRRIPELRAAMRERRRADRKAAGKRWWQR